MGAQQLQVDEQEIHLGVADPLAHTQGGGVYAIDAGLDRREAVDEAHSPVAVAMPIHSYVLGPYDLLLYKSYQRLDAIRRGVSHRVRQADPHRAAVDRRAVQRLQGLGFRPGRILSDVHDRKAVLDGVRHRLLGGCQDAVEGPVFGVLPDWGRAYECGRLDGDADLLGDSDDRLHVGYHRAGRAVGEDGQPLVPDLLGERPHLLDDPRPGPRQPEVGRHDAEVGHEVQQLPLDLERGVPDRGGLESVAQGLVVQVDLDPRPVEPGAGPVPVVNQFTLVHDPSVALSPGTVKPVSVNGWIRPSRACSRMSASAPRAITSSAPTR